MEKYKLSPEKITKPIQLLGAWLVGLLAVDSAFLTAVTKMDSSSWQSGALTVAAIINVPLFIGALFLLQTRSEERRVGKECRARWATEHKKVNILDAMGVVTNIEQTH